MSLKLSRLDGNIPGNNDLNPYTFATWNAVVTISEKNLIPTQNKLNASNKEIYLVAKSSKAKQLSFP